MFIKVRKTLKKQIPATPLLLLKQSQNLKFNRIEYLTLTG
jgi:hypothetical protein